jgi:hypothetical protein
MGGGRAMAISVFLSTVSDEFRSYHDLLVHDLTRHSVAVKVQEDFNDLGGNMLDKLDIYIAHCDAVVHLVGDMCGSSADETQQRALAAKHSDLQTKLPPLGEALGNGLCLPYTQWEAWLALYHCKSLLVAMAKATAPRGPKYAPTDAFAHSSSGPSRAPRGVPSLSRQRVHRPRRTGQANRLHDDSRFAGRGLCPEAGARA